MATEVYKAGYIQDIYGNEIYVSPLKIKYLREFMDAFEYVKTSTDDDESLLHLVNCVRICMKQYAPQFETTFDVEDNFDIGTIYEVLEYAAGIKIKQDQSDISKQAKSESENSDWSTLDLAKLESEVFLLGIWKDYDELESSISLQELTAILNTKREDDYNQRKFLAAIQGVDLDAQSGKKEENAWEKMKAKVFSRGKTDNPNDIVSFQGAKASKAGFGIGMGLGYEDLTKK